MLMLMLSILLGASYTATGSSTGELFQRPQFGDGMILQRGTDTLVFGYNAAAPVTVKVEINGTETHAVSGSPDAANNGRWIATLPNIKAAHSSTVTATDGKVTDTLNDVAWGDVLLCGGKLK